MPPQDLEGQRLRRFSGNDWFETDFQYNGVVLTLAATSPDQLSKGAPEELFVGGLFDSVANVQGNRLGHWNGSTATGWGCIFDGPIEALHPRYEGEQDGTCCVRESTSAVASRTVATWRLRVSWARTRWSACSPPSTRAPCSRPLRSDGGSTTPCA